MKPARFEYSAPESVDAALALLDDDAKPLAGGQSLIPMLNFRLARPARLVDLGRIGALAYLRRSGGVLRIGALTRQVTLERSALLAAGWPLLRDAVAYVGHPAIRTRGTVGGSIAHADPAAELPGALLALRAVFHVRSRRGARTVAADAFFRGPMTTVLAPDELLCEIEVPALPTGARCAFIEHARTHGDFALGGAGVVIVPGSFASIAIIGAGPVPRRCPEAESALVAGASSMEVGRLAGAGVSDDYRRALIGTLVERAVGRALA
ncbi:MAG: aerobic carbon-monoxide dehydrogenase medium subunit [Solirubrobacteraceae bacterium]|nr:aerobic carbon-monoxide dehydrogenase medium subunit [Solirubrobacteraceae bacterium]